VPSASPAEYPPQTAEFDYWQTLNALVAGIQAWREMDGQHLPSWFGDQRSLPVYTNAGDDLNAFYDRGSLQFFSHTFGGKTVHSAESVDIVTHEEGHALLDAIRPDFFDVPFPEVGAIHESFGDCMAIATAFRDRAIRDHVLKATPDLSKGQFVESVAEQLGDAIRREYGPDSVEKGALRHALNKWIWSDPTSLPSYAPADELSAEVHSFSRVFSGIFYDTIRNIFKSGPKTSAGLLKASRTSGKLLVSAIRTVPAAPRIFEGVGQRMLQADAAANRGTNVPAIRAAFDAHGISLTAPVVSLPVPISGKGAAGVRGELRSRMEVPAGTRLRITPVSTDLHGEIAHVSASRPLRLTGDGLDGVEIMVPAAARVARRGRGMGELIGDVSPITTEAEDNARAFARSLVASGQLRVSPRVTRRARGVASAIPQGPARTATHEIRVVRGTPTIVRRGFV
jgi:hypothetical protein